MSSLELLTDQNLVLVGDERIRLKPKAMDVLGYLYQQAPHSVSVEDLIEHCWPQQVVGDSVVYKRVNELRQQIRDDNDEPLIETVPGRGYRLRLENLNYSAGAVSSVTQNRSQATRLLALAVAVIAAFVFLFGFPAGSDFDSTPDLRLGPQTRTIAVKPFDAPEGAHFGHALQPTDALRVISPIVFSDRRLSLERVRDEFGATGIVDGHLYADGEGWRLNVQYVDTHSGVVAWSRQFQVAPDELMDVTGQVVAELRTFLRPVEPAQADNLRHPHPDAYRHLLRARELAQRRVRDSSNISLAIEELRAAIRIDPDYGPSYAELSRQQVLHAFRGGGKDYAMLLAAEQNALAALRLAPLNAGAYLAAGEIYKTLIRDYDQAADHFADALRVNPSDAAAYEAYAHGAALEGNVQLALQLIERAIEINPFAPLLNRQRGRYLLYAGQYTQAIDALHRARYLNPDDAAASTLLWIAYHQLDRPAEAQEALFYRKSRWVRPFYRAATALLGEQRVLSLIVWREQQSFDRQCGKSADITSQLQAYLGHTDDMFVCLERAQEVRETFFRLNPLYKPYREDARFAAVDRFASSLSVGTFNKEIVKEQVVSGDDGKSQVVVRLSSGR
ncbi:MAG: winged helix-turn-helix domain-containing protein [Pseudomonadota bacterium]